jgi:hypothetical protein
MVTVHLYYKRSFSYCQEERRIFSHNGAKNRPVLFKQSGLPRGRGAVKKAGADAADVPFL